MMEQLGYAGKRTKREEGGSDSKLNRETSNGSRNSSSSKFLKRKPDSKKLFLGNGSKKRRQTSATEYFDRDLYSDQPADSESLSEFQAESDKNMGDKHLVKGSLKMISDKTNKMLETAKSESNLFLRRKELDIAAAGQGNLPAAQNGNNPEPSTSQNNSQPDQIEMNDDYAQFAIHNRVINKKSRTEFFTYQNFQGLEGKADSVRMDDAYELSSTRQQGDLSKEYRKIKADCESYIKKNKWLQEEMELYMEREYLLQTEKKHLGEIIKQKDKIIDRLQRQKGILAIRTRTEIEKQILKSRQEVEFLKRNLIREEERLNNLKEENEFIRNQLVSKSEELVHVYDKYNDLEDMYHRDQATMLAKFDKMKQDIEKPKETIKDQQYEFTDIGQLQKWKERIVRLQEEIKYLKIQNQCLLISKDQLRKCELQNRKLKDERDYFKRKVLESVKRNKRNTKDVSSDNSSSVLLELSQISIEK